MVEGSRLHVVNMCFGLPWVLCVLLFYVIWYVFIYCIFAPIDFAKKQFIRPKLCSYSIQMIERYFHTILGC